VERGPPVLVFAHDVATLLDRSGQVAQAAVGGGLVVVGEMGAHDVGGGGV
jgi:hypothetical protein